MNPLALVQFGGRIGPFLGRLVASSPGVLAKIGTRLRASGAVVGEKLTDIVNWARANPVNAALLSSTLASMGFAVADLFKDSKDPEIQTFARDLEALTLKAKQRAGEMVADIGDDSESKFFVRESDEQAAAKELLKRTLKWARDHFGGEQAAVTAHQYLQVFSEIPADLVRTGFKDYDLGRVSL